MPKKNVARLQAVKELGVCTILFKTFKEKSFLPLLVRFPTCRGSFLRQPARVRFGLGEGFPLVQPPAPRRGETPICLWACLEVRGFRGGAGEPSGKVGGGLLLRTPGAFWRTSPPPRTDGGFVRRVTSLQGWSGQLGGVRTPSLRGEGRGRKRGGGRVSCALRLGSLCAEPEIHARGS